MVISVEVLSGQVADLQAAVTLVPLPAPGSMSYTATGSYS